MGLGGAKKQQKQLDQQLALMRMFEASQAGQQSSQRASADNYASQQAALAAQEQEQAKAELQKKSKLSVFDAIRTSPSGLLNSEPSTGKFSLLGNA